MRIEKYHVKSINEDFYKWKIEYWVEDRHGNRHIKDMYFVATEYVAMLIERFRKDCPRGQVVLEKTIYNATYFDDLERKIRGDIQTW